MMNGKPIKTSTRVRPCAPEGGLRAPARFDRVRRRVSAAAGTAMLSAALLLGGCSKEPAGETARTAITVSATLPAGAAEASTKAVADGGTALALSFARADETSAGTYGAYGAELTGTRAAGAGEQPLSFDPVQYYVTGGLKTRMTGWYPGGATEPGDDSGKGFYDASAGTVSWKIDGSQDIIASEAMEGSATAPIDGFTFTHRLAQIQIWPYAESDAVAAQWGPVKSIALLSQPYKCTLTLPDPATAEAALFAAAGKTDFTVRNLPEGNLPTTAAIIGDPVMIAPRTTEGPLSLIVVAAEAAYKVDIPARAYPAGSVTALKLKFTSIEVQMESAVTIAEWADGGNVDIGHESKTYPYVTDGNTIVVSDLYGSANSLQYPVHEVWTSTPRHDESAWNANKNGKNTYAAKFVFAKANAKPSVNDEWWPMAGVVHPKRNPDGYSACGEYSEEPDQSDKGKWRLPTVRELKLAFDMMSLMNEANRPAGDVYWTATETAPDGENAWRVRFDGGSNAPYNFSKANGARVRCVRDVETEASYYPYVTGGNTIVVSDLYGSADPGRYPTHAWWSTTPSHDEPDGWSANASGKNTVGESFEVAENDALSLSGSNRITYYQAAGMTHETYNPTGYSACASYSQGADDAGGWRLPTIRELKLMNDKKGQLSVHLQNTAYWSMTGHRGGWMWEIPFNNGNPYTAEKHQTLLVRCVRDANRGLPAITEGRFVISTGDGMQADYPIRDGVWSSTPESHESTWEGNSSKNNTASAWFEVAEQDAGTGKGYLINSLCASYSQASGPAGTWRSPTARELQLIYDNKRDLTGGDPLKDSWYWAGTRYNYDDFWRINIATGEVAHSNHNASAFPVRCVRDIPRTVPYVAGGRIILSSNGIRNASYPIHAEKWTTTPAHTESEWEANASGKNTVGKYIEVADKVYSNVMMSVGVSSCAEHTEKDDQSDKGQWRLPTIREAMLISSMKEQLTPDYGALNWLWSRTEKGGGEVWCWRFGATEAEHHPGGYGGTALCVRDL